MNISPDSNRVGGYSCQDVYVIFGVFTCRPLPSHDIQDQKWVEKVHESVILSSSQSRFPGTEYS